MKGFTLVELLITLAIIGILTAISVPMIAQVLHGNSETSYSGECR